MPRPTRSKLITMPIVAVVALIALAVPAFAHVEAEGETSASGITTVTFSFQHGCADSPTTSLKIELPAGTTEVKAQDPAGFTSAVTADTLTWSGGSIPATTPGTFVADMRIVGNAGDTIFLPTVQVCAQGENDWIEKTDDPEADNAAPRITLTQTVAPVATSTTAASGSTSSTAATSTTESVTETTSDAAAKDAQIVKDSDNSPIGTIVIVVIVLIIAGGALILYLRNRKPKPSDQ
ncbi:MAG: DUF1775 domain-containing protein [Acidimicrobiales bacterium]